MHQRRGVQAEAGAEGRGRAARAPHSGEQRSGEGTGQRDSIADGTALRNIMGEEVAATFGDTEDLFPEGSLFVATRHRLPTHPRCLPFADTTLVRVTKPRFGSKYSGVLRSPQELKIIGGPIVVRLDALLIFCPS